ncbi:hypothetical protein [Calothrix sp. PCC 6303]|uniref:hypothetical protein n=1 Tax=Calothrix sp. PCC 6303 TaxID=1170562 RepID=UPI0002A02BFE|nr:hypothetical protein [Calothrix sp. PCC 6303]AFZ01463.1 hypothetical protein Cal6303_2468 [Calothrix sp. PCC 6303]
MTLKTTILAIVGSLTLAIPQTYQYTFAETPSKLSQAQPSLKASGIPKSVVLQVRQDMAKQLNFKLTDVRFTRIESKIFDACLNLPAKNEKCKEIGYKGWAIRVGTGKQSWLYHAVSPQNISNNFRINWLQSLPKDVKQTVISNVTRFSKLPLGKIKVVSVEPRIWKNNCLELAKTDQRCDSTKTPGWLIKLKSDTYGGKLRLNEEKPSQWVYRSDLDGKIVELDLVSSMGNLSQKVNANILSDAAKRSQTQPSAWRVDKIQNLQWSTRSGDGPSRPITGAVPVENYTFGWKVLVSSPQQKWVYYATKNGFEFDAPKSVPSYLVEEAIKAASVQTGKPASNFRLHWAELLTWDDTCLGVTINKPACEKTPVLGWRISLMESNSTLFTFHSRFDRDVRFAGSSPWFFPPSANPGGR